MLDVLKLDALEDTGAYEYALKLLRDALRRGEYTDQLDELAHRLGRLYQRLQHTKPSERAYWLALSLNSSRANTINNLAVLKMGLLDFFQAEILLEEALKSLQLTEKERALLLNSSCELRLYQRRPQEAAWFAQEQLKLCDTARARTNLGIALRYLNDLQGSLHHQEIGLRQILGQESFSDHDLNSSIGRPHTEGVNKTLQLHLAIMNYGIARLSLNPWDSSAQYLLLAGAAIEPFSWNDPQFFKRMWRGQYVDELVLWHDQGYGDAIQNLAWIQEVCKRVDRLKLLLRPSLVRLVEERLSLPSNCSVYAMNLDSAPWLVAEAHLGLWFAPLALGGWQPEQPALQTAALKSFHSSEPDLDRPRIGLVWMAGRHQSPQPELAARMRDLPFSCFAALDTGTNIQSSLL